RAPAQAELPPFHGGIVGWIGYDTVREIERLPNVPDDDLGFPDAVCSLAGQVAAFDHFRQRLFLIENVYPSEGADAGELTAKYEAAAARLDAAVEELGHALPYAPALPPPDELTELPAVTRGVSPQAWAEAV